MRVSSKAGEKQAIIHTMSHIARIDIAQARQAGDKSSEITVMHEFLNESGLDKHKISLDVHNCNPETMTQIEQAGGLYLIQVKENQTKLLKQCRIQAEKTPLALHLGNGSINVRQGSLHDLPLSDIDERWQIS